MAANKEAYALVDGPGNSREFWRTTNPEGSIIERMTEHGGKVHWLEITNHDTTIAEKTALAAEGTPTLLQLSGVELETEWEKPQQWSY